MKSALTIAGSDPGAGAGIQADLKTFAAHAVYGASAITAITAQNSRGVAAVFPLSPEAVTAQIEAVANDTRIDATKIGMLATGAIVDAVAAAIRDHDLPRVVLDPVMIATSGERLLDDPGVAALRAQLLPRSFVVTPNIAECRVLADMAVETVADVVAAAKRIVRDSGAAAVIVKGGHLSTTDAIDILFDGANVHELRGPRLENVRSHGTGCTFASAVAAQLALGRTLLEAATAAKAYVFGAMKAGISVGGGRLVLNHFWMSSPGDRGTKP